MAIVSNPLIGASKNKIGGVVFTSWKGKNVLKNKPLTVANPQSNGQREQRNKLSAVVAVYRLIAGAILYGFKQDAQGQSEYNAFVSYNLKFGVTVVDPDDVSINPATLRVSNGSLGTTTPDTVVVDNSSANVVVTFPTGTPISGQAATDKCYAVLHNATDDTWEYLGTNGTRADGTATFPVSMTIDVADDTYVYFFFVSADGNKSSVSTINNQAVQA